MQLNLGKKHLLESEEDSCTNNPETNFCRGHFLATVGQRTVSTEERFEQSKLLRFCFL